MPGTSKKISELDTASSLGNSDLLEVAVVNALSETGYSSKKTTIEDIADKVVAINPQEQADWTEADDTEPSYIKNKPTLATVATSGSYEDLSHQPTIPPAQVNSDWNSVSGVSEILNKPTLGTSASKDVGVANGVAGLDANGLVPTSQLPAYVDDVLEYASRSAFPATGETGKIYVALDTNLTYRWGGSEYVEISPSLALGETSSTAYAGNKGKANADAISTIQTTLSGLATVATTGNYADLTGKPTIPTVNNATVTFTQGGTTKGTITLNQSADATIAFDAGGGGASALDDLSDVTITSPTAGQVLKYDAINDEWVNGTGGSADYQELTYDEYMALSPAQKTDGTMYFLTDVNGDGSQFQPICYSETEREIGVWVDGKPLYQKSINYTLSSVSDWTILDNSVSYDTLVFISGTSSTSAEIRAFGNTYQSEPRFIVKAVDNALYYYTTNAFSGYVTIQYTKTTDQAGSGTWTPQGVPATQYSQSEHIVGTWVDGSTLYEKTLTFTAPSSNAYTSQSLGVTVDYVSIIETSIVKGSQVGTLCGAYNGNPANDEWQGFINLTNSTLDYRVGSSYYGADCYVTIRYTKASS